MIVYLRRNVSDVFSRYSVFDDKGNMRYDIVGRHSTSGEKINILKGNEIVAKIRDFDLGLLNSFTIRSNGNLINIFVTKNSKGLSASFRNISWRFRGDIMQKNYDIVDLDNSLVCGVCAEYHRGFDSYKIEVFTEERELFCIATAVCLDLIKTAKTPALQMS